MRVRQIWIVAYDSPSDRRRRKLAELLEGYGQRLQWSVFECRLKHEELQALARRLERLVDSSEDRVGIWPIPRTSCARVIQFGIPVPPPPPLDFVV